MAVPDIFDASLQLTRIAPGKYRALFASNSKQAEAFKNVNQSLHGGLVIAFITKAISLELESRSSTHTHPLTLSTQFIAATLADIPIIVTVEIVKSARRFTFVRARLEQLPSGPASPLVRIDANGCYGAAEKSPETTSDFVISDFTPPPLPSPSNCQPIDLLLAQAGVFPLSPDRDQDFRHKLTDPAAVESLKQLARTVRKGKVDKAVMNLKVGAWVGFENMICTA
ncbi:hypothetical protein HDU93_001201 [Gonapodya sp. JEL0774]|nr:hypothetical protein HDU93_001201 [Gonapodya sp. JEL0774]